MSPERLRTAPALAPFSQVAAASLRVALFAAVISPRRSEDCASARHAFASALLANVLRSRRFSRRS